MIGGEWGGALLFAPWPVTVLLRISRTQPHELEREERHEHFGGSDQT